MGNRNSKPKQKNKVDANQTIPSLHKILTTESAAGPYSFEAFKKFCESLYVDENVRFWRDVELYKKQVSESSSDYYKQEVQRIVKTYLVDGAPSQVNIAGGIQRKILQKINNKFDKSAAFERFSVFDEIQDIIFHMMHTSIYPDFCDMIKSKNSKSTSIIY